MGGYDRSPVAKDKWGQLNIPICAYSLTSGLVGGTEWKPMAIVVNRTGDNKRFEYFVDGIVEWKLLGARIYSQSKHYEEVALIK